VWAADLTYLPTRAGWLYLAVVLDVGSRRIVGWAMDRTMARALPLAALTMAFAQRGHPTHVLHHSDRGRQYSSADYQAVLAHARCAASMSRKGDCWDNAVVESFFATLKTELVEDANWTTRAEARQAVFEYLESWNSRQRLHSTLGYRTPLEYEAALETGSSAA
jgi:putative transposase